MLSHAFRLVQNIRWTHFFSVGVSILLKIRSLIGYVTASLPMFTYAPPGTFSVILSNEWHQFV